MTACTRCSFDADAEDLAFVGFRKIPRWSKEIVITEKIDGTNAQIVVPADPAAALIIGSRNRYIDLAKGDKDNYGFARWVMDNAELLRRLGPGRHYGEWWGAGIGPRKYGQTGRVFSLFNVGRWTDAELGERGLMNLVRTVPVLYRGPMSEDAIVGCIAQLTRTGSVAAPGFMNPEGVVVFHGASGCYFKRFCDPTEDANAKGAAGE